jgi:hypothetical protein
MLGPHTMRVVVDYRYIGLDMRPIVQLLPPEWASMGPCDQRSACAAGAVLRATEVGSFRQTGLENDQSRDILSRRTLEVASLG